MTYTILSEKDTRAIVIKPITNFTEARAALLPYAQAMTGVNDAYTLERIVALLKVLGNPQDKLKVVHVAGTSGKTSTSYYVAAMLQATGKKVGLTVSPHLDEVNERLQINLQPLPEALYCAVLSEFLDVLSTVDIQPTYFELLVALAYWYFAKVGVDYAVVEVGLGGLLDGTNVVNRVDKVCLITDIGIDHAHILGDTAEQIAEQKAGIIQNGNAVFSFNQDVGVMEVLLTTSARKQAVLYSFDYDAIRTDDQQLPVFQRRNWQLAGRVLDYLSSRDGLAELTSDKSRATQTTYIPGRMEILQVAGKTLVLDGAHNPQKMHALAASLRERFTGQPIAFLLSFKEGKDIVQSVAELRGLAGNVITTEFNVAQDMQHKSASAGVVARACNGNVSNVTQEENSRQALAKLLQFPEKVVVVTGSFYLLHEIRPFLRAYGD